VPGIVEKVERAEKISISAQDPHGKPFVLQVEGLLAHCLQHELDHLDGIVFIEKLSRLKFTRLLAKMKKIQREAL